MAGEGQGQRGRGRNEGGMGGGERGGGGQAERRVWQRAERAAAARTPPAAWLPYRLRAAGANCHRGGTLRTATGRRLGHTGTARPSVWLTAATGSARAGRFRWHRPIQDGGRAPRVPVDRPSDPGGGLGTPTGGTAWVWRGATHTTGWEDGGRRRSGWRGASGRRGGCWRSRRRRCSRPFPIPAGERGGGRWQGHADAGPKKNTG